MLIVAMVPGLHIVAQAVNYGIKPDIPPSPQAIAFNRLGDYQLNNNYGMPDISIPLFEIDFHGYKIPLTLHYEASPLKPGYNYDVTGQGWTLSGNSCVSRTIKDRADEDGTMFNNPFTLDSFNEPSGTPKRYIDYGDRLDKLNYQYDSYNIVLPSGRTIPFFMYKSGYDMQYELMPSDCHVKINCYYSQNSIDSLTVIDENGVTYAFTVADLASVGFDNDPNADRNVTWMLTRIDIPAKGTINYEYTDVRNIQTNIIEEPVLRVSRLSSQMLEDATLQRFSVSSPPQPECPRYRMRFLSRISYGPTRIDFNYQPDKKHMKEIVVSDCGDTIRKFSLAISASSSFASSLTSLVITGQNNEDQLVYRFLYTNSNPGNRTDYWGNRCNSNSPKDLGNFNMYFNIEEDGNMRLNRNSLNEQLSQNNLVQLIDNEDDDPYYYYKIKLQSTTDGDSRQPTPPESHGVLNRIIYPNGGYTVFNWENHRFLTATAANGDFIFDRRSQRIIEGGGFRIKSIVNYTVDDSIASEEHYRYGFTYGDIIQRNFPLPLPDTYNINDHIGCGEAVVDPNLLTFMTFSYFDWSTNAAPPDKILEFQKMAIGKESTFRTFYNIQGRATWWDAFFSANTFRALLGGRQPVVYPEITVYHGNPDVQNKCIGKTVYKYDIYSYTHAPSTYYMSSFEQTSLPDTAYFERIYYYFDAPGLVSDNYQAAKRHQLKLKSDYSYDTHNESWNLVSEEKYAYNEETLSKSGSIYNSHFSRECRTNYIGILDNGEWQPDKDLGELYIYVTEWFGRSTMSNKSTTTLRQGGTKTIDNTQTETYSYLYPGVLKSREYSDLFYRVRYDYLGGSCDKKDEYFFVGEADDSSNPAIAEMKARNMLTSLISAETTNFLFQTSRISGSRTDYNFFGNKILPSKLYESNGDVYEESMEILSYDAWGNPTEIEDLKTGIHSVFIWGSYGRYLTAVINNATWSQIQDTVSGNSVTRYATFRNLLPNAQVQTWDYKPLIGVSSHTDVNGETYLYEYDGLGRLKTEKRIVNGTAEPEILHEYEYNYFNQY